MTEGEINLPPQCIIPKTPSILRGGLGVCRIAKECQATGSYKKISILLWIILYQLSLFFRRGIIVLKEVLDGLNDEIISIRKLQQNSTDAVVISIFASVNNIVSSSSM